MKKLISSLIMAAALSVTAIPATFAATQAEITASGLSAAQLAAIPAAELDAFLAKLASAPAATRAFLLKLSPTAIASVGALPLAQLNAVASLSPAQQAALVAAVVEVNASVLAGKAVDGALAAKLASALAPLGGNVAGFASALANELKNVAGGSAASLAAAAGAITVLSQVPGVNSTKLAELATVVANATPGTGIGDIDVDASAA